MLDFPTAGEPKAEPTEQRKTDTPLVLSSSDERTIRMSGIGSENFKRFGSETDLPAIRTAAGSLTTNTLYTGITITLAGSSIFPSAWVINPIVALYALLFAYMTMQIQRFLNLRGLYARGKHDCQKRGLKIAWAAEDANWLLALLGKAAITIPLALIVGNTLAGMWFAPEIKAYNWSLVASKNAAIIAVHKPAIQFRIDTAKVTAQQDGADYKKAKAEEEQLRKQDVANTRRAATQSARQQERYGTENVRQQTATTLSSYERKSAMAQAKASASSKAYDDLLRNSGADLQALVERDPAYVAPPSGFLAQLKALRAIADQSAYAEAGIWLFEAVGVGLELWLLISVICACPVRLASNLYLDYLMATTKAASDASVELEALKASKDTTHRGPGRPKGSLNRPKPVSQAPEEVAPEEGKELVAADEASVTLSAPIHSVYDRDADAATTAAAGNDNHRRSLPELFKAHRKASRSKNPGSPTKEGGDND